MQMAHQNTGVGGAKLKINRNLELKFINYSR